MLKKIKKSKRGLTFTLNQMKIGERYKYVIDKAKKEIRIIPDISGKITVSRKKCGKSVKPLMDIRSSEVRELVSSADSIELEMLSGGNILVRIIKKRKDCRANVVSIYELLEKKVSEYIITPQMLAVSGGCNYQTINGKTLFDDCYFDYISSNIPTYVKKIKKEELKKVYDVVSLFSGAGMFDKAFMDGRFRFVYGVDFEPAAVNTYRHNIGNHIECKDIRKVDENSVPKADVIIGGPCCQAFSNENRRNQNTEAGEKKRLLVDEYVRITKAKNPKVWVIENVPELLTKEDGFYFNRVIEGLSDYEITATVVHDDAVGGYSIRKRAIVIGSKIGKIELPEQNLSYKTVREALSEVDSTWSNYNDVTKPKPDTELKMSFVKPGGNWKDIPAPYNTYGENTHSSIMRRLEEDKPSITLSNFRKTNILHPTENRILSVAEAAAIMGMKNDFEFLGNLSEKQQMVANGVTQAIGRFVKNTVLKALDSQNISLFPAKQPM